MRRTVRRGQRCAAVALIVAAGVPLGTALAQTPLTQPVADPRGRFTISFPAHWEVATKPEGIIALVGAGPERGGHRPTVNVVIEALPGPMSPEDYASAAEQIVRTTLHDYTVVRQGAASVAGRPAYYRYFTWETNTNVSLYELQVYFTVGPRGFVVTGSTLNERDHILEDGTLFTQIINTFKPVSAAR